MAYDPKSIQQLRDAAAVALHQFGSFDGQALAYLSKIGQDLGLDENAVMEVISGTPAVTDSPPPLARTKWKTDQQDNDHPPLLTSQPADANQPPQLTSRRDEDSPPPLVCTKSDSKSSEEAPAGDEAYKEYAQTQLDAGKTTPEELQQILDHGRATFKISHVYARHLLEDIATEASLEIAIPGSKGTVNQSTTAEPRVKDFVDRARGHIGVEGGINVKSRMLMDREAEDLQLTASEREIGMEILTSAMTTNQSRDDERAAELQRDLEIQLQDLSGVVQVSVHESIHRNAVACYGVASETASRVMKDVAESYGLKLFSREHVTGLLEQMCESLVGETGKIRPDDAANLHEQAGKLGLTVTDSNAILKSRVDKHKKASEKENTLSRRLVAVAVALPVIAAVLFFGVIFLNREKPETTDRLAKKKATKQNDATPQQLAVPAWWSDDLKQSADRTRQKIPAIVSELDRIQTGGVRDRVAAYAELANVVGRYFRGEVSGVSSLPEHRTRQAAEFQELPSNHHPLQFVAYQTPLLEEKWLTVSVQAREAGELVGKILAEFYAHDPEEEAIEQIRKDLRELMEVASARNTHDYHLAIWATKTALAAHAASQSQESRQKELRQNMGAVLGEPIYATAQADVEKESWQRLTSHLFKQLAVTDQMTPEMIAASYQIVDRTGSELLDVAELNELKLHAICAVLPTSGDMWQIYLKDLATITETADPPSMNRILEVYQQVGAEQVRKQIANLLLARIGEPLDSVANGSKLVEFVREKMAAAASTNPKQDKWAGETKELLAGLPVGMDTEETMLRQILELAHRGVQGCALYKQARGSNRFDRLEDDGPPVPEAAVREAISSRLPSGLVVPGTGGFSRTSSRNRISIPGLFVNLNNGKFKKDHFKIYSTLVPKIKPADLTPIQAAILARYILEAKNSEERESVNDTLSDLAGSGYVVLAVADGLAKARIKQEYLLEICTGLIGREVKASGANWKQEAIVELMRFALPRFNVSAEADTGELIDSAAKALSQLYIYHAELHGLTNTGAAEDQLPGDVLEAVVRHFSVALEKEELSSALEKQLETVKLELDVVDFLTSQDVQRIVVLQRTYLKLLAIQAMQRNPDLQKPSHQLINDLYQQDRSSRHVLEQVRGGEAALIQMWKLVLFRKSSAGDSSSGEQPSLDTAFEESSNVSKVKLAGLRTEDASGYRDYAEELAEKKDDPVAIATSIRLYLIAAYLHQEGDPDASQGNLALSCLLGMRRLSRNVEEEKLFVSMARLLGDKQPLKLGSAQYRNRENAQNRALAASCQKALQGLRSQTVINISRTQKEQFKGFLKPYADILPHDELIAAFDAKCDQCSRGQDNSRSCSACGGRYKNPVQPSKMVYKIVKTELALTERELLKSEQAVPRQKQAAPGKKSPWSQILLRKEIDTVAPLSIRYATEYDAAKCLFQNGSWVEP